MKYIRFWILLVVCGSWSMLSAQTDGAWRDSIVEVSGEWEVRRIEPSSKPTFGSILNNLTLPLEVGCAFTPQMGQTRPGFYMRTSLEYRSHKTVGWCVAAEFDSYTRKYENQEVNGINVTQGRDWTIDILAGGGYRVPLVKDIPSFMAKPLYDNIWSIGWMLYAGGSCQTLQKIVPDHYDDQGEMLYHVETLDTWVPTIKMTMSVEYSICYGISVYATMGYLQHIQKTQLESSYIGELITSIGITCFFR